tara:strand:- start:169 stop:654 length:486 start_codon:yes stop_codon:yes gene_type:complete
MIKKENKLALIVWALVLSVQIFIPAFNFNEIQIKPDLILVLVSFVALKFGADFAIIFAFLNGLIQDFTTQNSLLGILTLAKSLAIYIIHFIQNFNTIWTRKIKILYIFLAYLLHNLIYYYFYLSGDVSIFSIGIFIILIHSIISFIIFLVFEKILFKSKLL